jgi:hypothetical protein
MVDFKELDTHRMDAHLILRMHRLLMDLGLHDYYYGSKRVVPEAQASLGALRFGQLPPNDDAVFIGDTCVYLRNGGHPLLNVTAYPCLHPSLQEIMRDSLESRRFLIEERILDDVPLGTDPAGLRRLYHESLCRQHGVPHGTVMAGRGGGPLVPVDVSFDGHSLRLVRKRKAR